MNYKGTLLGDNHMLVRYISDTRTQGADDFDPLGGYWEQILVGIDSLTE